MSKFYVLKGQNNILFVKKMKRSSLFVRN